MQLLYFFIAFIYLLICGSGEYLACPIDDEEEGSLCCVSENIDKGRLGENFCATSESGDPQQQCTRTLCTLSSVFINKSRQVACLNEFLDGNLCRLANVSECLQLKNNSECPELPTGPKGP